MTPRVDGVGNGDNTQYTPIKVRDKDSGNVYEINFVNARITGNEAKWEIKDGKLYDKDGNSIDNLTMEVTRYQAALIRAAAAGNGDESTLDFWDLNGLGYAEKAMDYLKDAKSEYKLADEGHYAKDYPTDPDIVFEKSQRGEDIPSADATEHGVIFADVANKKDPSKKGGITIDIRTEEQLADEQRRKEEAAEMFDLMDKPLKRWWKNLFK